MKEDEMIENLQNLLENLELIEKLLDEFEASLPTPGEYLKSTKLCS